MIRFPYVCSICCLLAATPGDSPDPLTAEQFFRVVQAQQSLITDFAFAFEGEIRVQKPDQKKPYTRPFQGRYALRTDGATRLEFVYEDARLEADSHVIKTILHGAGQLVANPDSDPLWKLRTLKFGGGPGGLFTPDTPETWNFVWRYQSLKGVADFGFKFLGWEMVDGRRCAHVDFDPHPEIPRRVIQELWVDLERGAHPLRIRNRTGSQIIYQIDQIKLGQFTLNSGERVWFPVSGVYAEPASDGNLDSHPKLHVASYILDGTLVFNQNLSDEAFQYPGARFRPDFKPTISLPPPPPPKTRAALTDARAVEMELDRKLQDPARQSIPVDATRALRAELQAPQIWQTLLTTAGIAVIALAGFLLWRRR
jgi:hypothetical protein